jgi:hypothetical protein
MLAGLLALPAAWVGWRWLAEEPVIALTAGGARP